MELFLFARDNGRLQRAFVEGRMNWPLSSNLRRPWNGSNLRKATCRDFQEECAERVALKSEIEYEEKLETG